MVRHDRPKTAGRLTTNGVGPASLGGYWNIRPGVSRPGCRARASWRWPTAPEEVGGRPSWVRQQGSTGCGAYDHGIRKNEHFVGKSGHIRAQSGHIPAQGGHIRGQIEHLSTITSDAATSERERVEVGAEALRDLAGLPSNRLEALSGDRTGRYSIRINRQWRICFRRSDDGTIDVEIVDYHR